MRNSWSKAELHWGLLWLCLGQPVQADTAATVAELIRGFDLEAETAVLQTRIADKLANPPRVVSSVELFDLTTRAPLSFSEPLEEAAARLRAQRRSSDYLQRLLETEWPRAVAPHPVAPGDSNGRSACGPRPPPLPDSLEMAADQVADLAQRVRVLQLTALPARGRARLQRDFERASALLLHPQPAEMSFWERRRLRLFLERLAAVDPQGLQCAARHWATLLAAPWLERVHSLMAGHSRSAQDWIVRKVTAQGEVVFGGRAGAHLQSAGLLALFDLAGDDVYGLESPIDFSGAPQLIVDFAGNDRYEGSRAGAYAAGLGRVALLQDRSGNDVYLGSEWLQGAAILGTGILQDLDGDDYYLARYYAQGAALSGLGALLDDRGHDHYQVAALGQGLGLQQGLGVLADAAGDDTYMALGGRPSLYGTPGLTDAWAQGVGLGLRGLAAGGLGVLADGGGTDNFQAGNFAQGGGYYRAVGMLLAAGPGDDRLFGSRYAQAWGAHGGVGYLWNEAGDDHYGTRHSVSAGLAWDVSLALFHDAAGDDSYRVGDFSLGASAYRSVAWFIDEAGRDEYRGTRPAGRDQGPPNLSLFLDREAAGDTLEGAVVAPGCSLGEEQGLVVWQSHPGVLSCPDAAATPPGSSQ